MVYQRDPQSDWSSGVISKPEILIFCRYFSRDIHLTSDSNRRIIKTSNHGNECEGRWATCDKVCIVLLEQYPHRLLTAVDPRYHQC